MKMAQLFLKSYAGFLKKGKAYYIGPNTAQGIVHDFLRSVNKRKQKNILKKKNS